MTESDEALEEVTRSVGMFALTVAFLAGFAVAWFLSKQVQHEESYREKVNFCADRMKSKEIRAWWRSQYCGNVKLEAIDPITGKPVAGIVEGE